MQAQLVWALMAAGSIPYGLTSAAKIGAFSPADNHRTRDWQAELTGWRQRAQWAQENGYEVYPLFVAAVLCSMTVHPTNPYAALFAWVFVGSRLVYSAFYIADYARLRTLTFFVSTAAVVALFVTAANSV